jgi:hypothetical protein
MHSAMQHCKENRQQDQKCGRVQKVNFFQPKDRRQNTIPTNLESPDEQSKHEWPMTKNGIVVIANCTTESDIKLPFFDNRNSGHCSFNVQRVN